jgi:hypothetical protein
MPTRRISQSIQIGDQTLSGRITWTAGAAVSIEEAVGASTTINILQTIDVSALKAIFIVPVGGDLVFTFNGPAKEFSLAENIPVCWFLGNDMTNPFGVTDVTSIDVLNEGDASATARIEILTDPTP